MKLLLIALTVLSSYFATANVDPFRVAPLVEKAFQNTFNGATDVHWAEINNLYRAQFTYNNQVLYAFYNRKGEHLCTGRHIEFNEFPPMLQLAFNKKYRNVKTIDAFEISDENNFSYYTTIETATERIILKSSGADRWSVFLKEKNR